MNDKISLPKIEFREGFDYFGIRQKVTISNLDKVIFETINQCILFLEKQNLRPNEPPIIRYHVCPEIPDLDNYVDVTIGFPLTNKIQVLGPFVQGTMPAGHYALLVYVGVENGILGNDALVKWAEKNGIKWDSLKIDLGDCFAARIEHLIDGPDDDPNPSNWRNEVAIKILEY